MQSLGNYCLCLNLLFVGNHWCPTVLSVTLSLSPAFINDKLHAFYSPGPLLNTDMVELPCHLSYIHGTPSYIIHVIYAMFQYMLLTAEVEKNQHGKHGLIIKSCYETILMAWIITRPLCFEPQ